MRRKRQYVEQIILVTDEGENTAPLFVDAYEVPRGAEGRPDGLLRAGRPGQRLTWRRRAGRRACRATCSSSRGDYYALPNLVPLLSPPSQVELLMEILEYPLPERKAV